MSIKINYKNFRQLNNQVYLLGEKNINPLKNTVPVYFLCKKFDKNQGFKGKNFIIFDISSKKRNLISIKKNIQYFNIEKFRCRILWV